MTELQYGKGKKAYLSAILNLTDKRIVAFKIGHSNNNPLVFHIFDAAIAKYPFAKPMVHSDRGFQYTSRIFHRKLQQAGMVQSVSRVGRCIDNGPMEGFWGTFKSEMFHRKRFKTFEELEAAIKTYIHFYNYDRLQAKLGARAPVEHHASIA